MVLQFGAATWFLMGAFVASTVAYELDKFKAKRAASEALRVAAEDEAAAEAMLQQMKAAGFFYDYAPTQTPANTVAVSVDHSGAQDMTFEILTTTSDSQADGEK